MRTAVVAIVAVFALLIFANIAFAFHFGNSFVFNGPGFFGPTSFRTFGATGFTGFSQPVFVGSVLHPATFWSMSTSRITTIPAFAAWNGFRPAFGGFW